MSETTNYRAHVLVCAGAGCVSCGCEAVADELKAEIDRLGLTNEVKVVLTGCMGSCNLGPVAAVVPEGIFYERLTPEGIKKIAEEHLLKGRVVEEFMHQAGQDEVYHKMESLPFFKLQHKIVLRNCGVIDPGNIEEYIARDGYAALAKAVTEMTPQTVIDEIKASGLRGRGGGGFPTGLKWQFTADATGDQKFVLCNADEGDPGAFMDRSVLEGDPHSLIEAMTIAGYAVGANQGYVYVRAEYPLAIERLQRAIQQAREWRFLNHDIFGSGFAFDLDIRIGAGAFVCGEETALMASIEGKRGEPRPRPPFPAISGLWESPTLLNNVETYANITWILLNGGEAFSKIGTEGSKGTKVFALAGAVENTGLVEVPMGMTLGDLVFELGGGVRNGKKFKAAQAGGPSGGCIPAEHLNVPMDYDSLKELGAMMGSGGLIVMDESTCMVDLARYFLDFIQDESCGKCTPCRIGTKRMLEILDRIAHGLGQEGDIELLIDLGTQIRDSALCGLGQTAPNPVLSTIRYFRDEYEAHIRDKQCPACVCNSLFEAPCSHTCPAGTSVPKYVSLIGARRFTDAMRIVRDHNPFVSVCGRVCNAPCESKCRRAQIDEPLSIRALKRFAADQADRGALPTPSVLESKAKDKKVAIIGAGPGGLTCAYHLARLGYKPVVFEAESVAGGMLVTAIPPYRLPRNVIAAEIEMIQSLGVEIKLNSRVDKTAFDKIKQDFDAVLVATGAEKGWTLGIPGEDMDGIYDAITFLKDVNLEKNTIQVGENVAVVGGGNSAIDAARIALRKGAKKVTILYRRLKADMPAAMEEIHEAEMEGIDIRYLAVPTEAIGDNGKVKSLKVQLLELAEFDKSGRRKPRPIEGSSFDLPVDTVITALSQEPVLDFLGDEVKLRRGGTIEIDGSTMKTTADGVFAGGDAVNGPWTVIGAIGDGIKAAVSIDRYLGGTGELASDTAEIEIPPAPEDVDDIVETPRVCENMLAVEKRVGMLEVDLGYTREQALREAARCLRCDAGH
ncbi:MAG: NADH-quinone oxidoreductase subunit NuoF [Armatimonadetes bacterium]|nr:NADH-quinone oxidoreductase subunit NuoF [Armatimonadota bacterium]